ncbi:MAG: hypothetical protein LW690_12370 [Opitutaceae bacterium]|nr:hypothetical protein [Opitutaceae bacterium]
MIVPVRSGERHGHMGAKYIPSIKDLKANARFQQKQNPQRKFKKAPPKKSKGR